MAAVGRVQHTASRRPGEPALRPAHGHRGEVDERGRLAREGGGWFAPLSAHIRGEQNQTAIAGQPGESRSSQPQLAN